MVKCYIGIGSNLGDRLEFINNAIAAIKASDGIKIARVSTIYETEPVGIVWQGKFLNGVIEIETALSARDLFNKLAAIESKLGRKRIVKNGPRTIDLDMLYYGEDRIEEKDLIVPHPRISEREFVLIGLRELGKA